ncbi:MAG: deiodinase family protein, partial [Planctomycetales bacterium]|nr:deiodinase family protein [Planctomycetales bacterium]
MYDRYGDQVQFFLVYIREAHPTDGRQSPANVREDILFEQPTDLLGRSEVAKTMCSELHLKMPAIVDKLDDATNQAYGASPDRLYLVGR